MNHWSSKVLFAVSSFQDSKLPVLLAIGTWHHDMKPCSSALAGTGDGTDMQPRSSGLAGTGDSESLVSDLVPNSGRRQFMHATSSRPVESLGFLDAGAIAARLALPKSGILSCTLRRYAVMVQTPIKT